MKFKLILILSIVIFGLTKCKNKQQISDKRTDELFAKSDSMTAKIQASGDRLDSVTNLTIIQTGDKINYLNNVKKQYSDKISMLEKNSTLYGETIDFKNRQIVELKKAIYISESTIRDLKIYLKKLNSRVSEDSLKIVSIQNKFEKVKRDYELKKIDPTSSDETIGGPDNVLLNFVTDSKKGTIKTPNNLNIYLLPAKDMKLIRDLIGYDINCNEYVIKKIPNYRVAKLYKGIYFFKNVPPGKYLIKVCYYYGNYKLFTKVDGQQTVTLEVAPPVQ